MNLTDTESHVLCIAASGCEPTVAAQDFWRLNVDRNLYFEAARGLARRGLLSNAHGGGWEITAAGRTALHTHLNLPAPK